MGTRKPLLPLGGVPALVRCVEALRAAAPRELVAVLVANAGPEEALLAPWRVTIARNPDPGADMAASARIGLAALAERPDGVLIALADHPLVRPETCRGLRARFDAEPGAIHLPVYGGHHGHPVLFPRELLDELNAGGTLRDIVHRYSERVRAFAVEDPGVAFDMDTPGDYARLRRLAREDSEGKTGSASRPSSSA